MRTLRHALAWLNDHEAHRAGHVTRPWAYVIVTATYAIGFGLGVWMACRRARVRTSNTPRASPSAPPSRRRPWRRGRVCAGASRHGPRGLPPGRHLRGAAGWRHKAGPHQDGREVQQMRSGATCWAPITKPPRWRTSRTAGRWPAAPCGTTPTSAGPTSVESRSPRAGGT